MRCQLVFLCLVAVAAAIPEPPMPCSMRHGKHACFNRIDCMWCDADNTCRGYEACASLDDQPAGICSSGWQVPKGAWSCETKNIIALCISVVVLGICGLVLMLCVGALVCYCFNVLQECARRQAGLPSYATV